jgi:hypothetical protein
VGVGQLAHVSDGSLESRLRGGILGAEKTIHSC